MRLIKEAWEDEEVEYEEEEVITTPIEPSEKTPDEIPATVPVEEPAVIVVEEPAQSVEVKVTSTTTAEVINPEFDDTRREIAADIVKAFHSGEIDLATMNKRVAAIFGSVEAAFKFLTEINPVQETEPEAIPVDITPEPEIEIETEITAEPVEDAEPLIESVQDTDQFDFKDQSEYLEKLASEIEELNKKKGKKMDMTWLAGTMREIAKEAREELEGTSLKESVEEVGVVANVEQPAEPVAEEGKAAEEVAETPDMPKAGVENFIADELNINIVGEWETIRKYNDFVATLESTPEAKAYESIINVIKDITAEEHEHIGQLQQALALVSPNTEKIEDGEKEGAEQLEAPVAEEPAVQDSEAETIEVIAKDGE